MLMNMFVCLLVLSQQFFSHVGTEPMLPGFNLGIFTFQDDVKLMLPSVDLEKDTSSTIKVLGGPRKQCHSPYMTNKLLTGK